MSYGRSVLFLLGALALLASCTRTSDISGVYKGRMTSSDNKEMGEIDIILNQKENNISGSLTFFAGTLEIKSGIIRRGDITVIAIKRGRDPNLMEYEIQMKFDGKIRGQSLDAHWVLTVAGYQVVGSFENISTVPVSHTYEGTLTATRDK